MCCSAHGVPMQHARNETRTERDGKMAFLKKHLKRAISMWLALLLSVPALPATAFAAQDNASTLAEVTAKFLIYTNPFHLISLIKSLWNRKGRSGNRAPPVSASGLSCIYLQLFYAIIYIINCLSTGRKTPSTYKVTYTANANTLNREIRNIFAWLSGRAG